MKKLYTLIILFVLMLSSFNSTAQYKSFFGDSLTEWYYVTDEVGLGFDIYPTIKISCDSDTTVNSVLYKTCCASRILPFGPNGSLVYDVSNTFLLAEDTDLGLLISRIQTDTIILDTICNLSLSLQDTFYYNGWFNSSIFSFVHTVDTIGGNKRLQFNYGSFIEGVGSTFSMAQVLYNSGLHPFGGGAPYAREILGCHLKDGNLNYKDSLGIYTWGVSKIDDCIWFLTTGIQEQKMGNSISIWPNPTKGIFTVDLSELTQNTNIVVYSVIGQEIINQKIKYSKTVFNLEGHDKGICFYQLTNGEERYSGNIIVQ